MTDQTWANYWAQSEISSRFPIFGSQVVRIGMARVLAGGGSMYLSIPLFFVIHVIGLAVGSALLAPLLGFSSPAPGNYIILDRHKIEGLHWFDKFNCVFCGWANGLSMWLHAWLRELGAVSAVGPGRKAAVTVIAVIILPVLVVVEIIGIQVIYNILVSRPLGMKRVRFMESWRETIASGYAAGLNAPARAVLRYQKTFDLRLENALEQIESSWCPLKHLDPRAEAVYPEHHKNFFGPDQIEQMKQVLRSEGTVSDSKPSW